MTLNHDLMWWEQL